MTTSIPPFARLQIIRAPDADVDTDRAHNCRDCRCEATGINVARDTAIEAARSYVAERVAEDLGWNADAPWRSAEALQTLRDCLRDYRKAKESSRG